MGNIWKIFDNFRVTFVQVLKNRRKSAKNFRQPSCDLRTSVKELAEIFGNLSEIFGFFISIKKNHFHNFYDYYYFCLFVCMFVCVVFILITHWYLCAEMSANEIQCYL